MPFTSVTKLPDNPDVRIFFSGLLILDPNPSPDPIPGVNTCEVYVHRSAPDHQLSIEVRRKRAGKPDIILMRHIGQLAFIAPPSGVDPRFGMTIRVNDDPKGVKRYDPPDPDHTSSEGEGLGLAIDLEHLPAQRRESVGGVNSLDGRPSILFNDAVFYTAAKTSKDVTVRLKKDDVVVVEKLDPFARVIGANIYLDNADSSVLVEWVQQGLPKVLELLKPEDESLSYEIYIVNEPLYEEEEPTLPRHDELKEYFKILPEARERFELEVPSDTPDAERGSTTTPCMPVIKGG